MKKILLVTLQGANLGNRLQNYALQEVLKKIGCIVYTPFYDRPENNSLKRKLKNSIKVILGFLGVRNFKYYLKNQRRIRAFQRFDNAYINNRFKTSFSKIGSNYDYAITGSDQVWHNWSKDKDELNYFYLRFMPLDKRISYAASFGFDDFPECDVDAHLTGLKEIEHLSCREENGRRLIKNLTGRDAVITLDPTMLLSREEWQQIEKKPGYETGKFLLVYFLGNITSEYKAAIEKIADDNNIKIINIFDPAQEKYFNTTPDEFIWLIENAEYICTDSFHACVFSIIFEKKFLAFHRSEEGMDKMFDRIETLFRCYGIDREYKGDSNKIYRDYENSSINKEINLSINFLENAII